MYDLQITPLKNPFRGDSPLPSFSWSLSSTWRRHCLYRHKDGSWDFTEGKRGSEIWRRVNRLYPTPFEGPFPYWNPLRRLPFRVPPRVDSRYSSVVTNRPPHLFTELVFHPILLPFIFTTGGVSYLHKRDNNDFLPNWVFSSTRNRCLELRSSPL